MSDIELIEYAKNDLSNCLLVVAFPTVGLISSIAGQFIIDTLKLKEIGTILSKEFMPATVIHNSKPSPPVRIYAGEKKCKRSFRKTRYVSKMCCYKYTKGLYETNP